MPFHNSGSIRYHTFSLFDGSEITHAIFTRQGGISPHPWASLNMGAVVGDDIDRVKRNIQSAFYSVDRNPESIYDVYQVHGNEVVCTSLPRPINAPHKSADSILTDNPDVTLFMRFGDCVPILLFDPVCKVVGLVHAGWIGTVDRVVSVTIENMITNYGCKPKDIRAGIGPSIGPDHYQVGDDVINRVRESYGGISKSLLQNNNGSTSFDLWEANKILLERAGVRQIEVSAICTACHLEDWYSHRGEKGKTGRFGALIGLNG
jgi:YfiH family protein